MELPTPTHKNHTSLMSSIKEGQVKIPQFQRDFVWKIEDAAKLLDSVVKGYPIGTFIFWKTQERLRSVRDIGNIHLPPAKENDFVTYVLDGQQRLTSLFAAFEGLEITRESGKKENFANIYINLKATESEEIVTTDVTYLDDMTFIRLKELLGGSIRTLGEFPEKYHNNLDEYKRRIEAYDFPIIEIASLPIDVATEIFTRLNVGGKPLTVFEIMVAKTYIHADDGESGFDLSEECNTLLLDLERSDYETIPEQVFLQLVSLILEKDCRRQTILKLERDAFVRTWPKAIDGIKAAVDHFRSVLRIPVSQLLPYPSLLVPIAYFFHRQPDRPTPQQNKELENFFWRCSLGERYSGSVDSSLAQDIKRIDQIVQGESPDYDWEIDVSPESLIRNGEFSTGRSFVKAILCILAHQQPKSFDNNGIVRIGNDWLKRSNSKNYHHFFPRAFLRRKGIDDSLANNIVNITIVDDYLNKREIGAKAPSEYMKKFQGENPNIVETMKTHLIGDLSEFGIDTDDYDTFRQKRAEAISAEIERRIIRK